MGSVRTGTERDPKERGQPPIGGLLLLLQDVRGWLGLGTGRGLARWDGVTVWQGRSPLCCPVARGSAGGGGGHPAGVNGGKQAGLGSRNHKIMESWTRGIV